MPSAFAELAGLICLVVAAAMLSPIAGFAVAGGCLLLIGQALDGVNVKASITGAVQRLRARRTTGGES